MSAGSHTQVTTTTRKNWLLSAAAIAMVGLTACAANSSTSVPDGGSAAPRAAQLDGNTFVASEVAGEHSIVPGSTITLAFEDGSLSAQAGCNYLSGPYTSTDNLLSAPQLGSTAMGCNPALSAQDTWLAAFLASPTWTYDGSTLTLTDGIDTVAMSKAPSGAEALEATGWKLVVLGSPRTYEPVEPGVRAWVRFSGSQVAFDTSCNRGGGSAEVTDQTITFGALRSTLVSCDGASGETERAMTAVLQGTATYRLEDPKSSTLTITSADGANSLQFTADPAVGDTAFTGTVGTATTATADDAPPPTS